MTNSMHRFFLLFITVVNLVSCESDYYPKPKAFIRIDLPEKSYVNFDTTYPYQFEYPKYGEMIPLKRGAEEKYWINIELTHSCLFA